MSFIESIAQEKHRLILGWRFSPPQKEERILHFSFLRGQLFTSLHAHTPKEMTISTRPFLFY
jgi:hypothetical protein